MSSLEFITEASPANRNLYCAYVALEDNKGSAVGTYVQGLYQLAQVGGLKCQVEAAAYADVNKLKAENFTLYKKLYHLDNGTLKTDFELAVINKINKDDIQNAITEEYTWQNNHANGILPQYVFKKHVGSEWLANLKLANSKFRMQGSIQGMMITVDNFKPKTPDRWTHSLFQVVGLIVTAFSLLGLAVATLPLNFLASLSTAGLIASVAAIALVATFITKVTTLGNGANFFGLAETLWTETPALLSNQFLKTNSSIAWGKLAQSIGFAVAIGGLSVMAAAAVFSSTLALPMMAGAGIAASIIAGFLATVSFIGSCVGMSAPVRLLSDSGFGIWDNRVPAEMINQANIQPVKSTKLAPAPTVEDKEKGLTALAPTKAARKEAKILDLTQKLEEAKAIRPRRANV